MQGARQPFKFFQHNQHEMNMLARSQCPALYLLFDQGKKLSKYPFSYLCIPVRAKRCTPLAFKFKIAPDLGQWWDPSRTAGPGASQVDRYQYFFELFWYELFWYSAGPCWQDTLCKTHGFSTLSDPLSDHSEFSKDSLLKKGFTTWSCPIIATHCLSCFKILSRS